MEPPQDGAQHVKRLLLEAPAHAFRVAEGLRHSRSRDAEAIHHHYDVSNAFYEKVLGPSMTYTCACYPNEGSTLEEAQENKYRLVFEKLRLKEGDRLLDIGCGWGGMVRYAARRGVRVIGATLSREQAAWALRMLRLKNGADPEIRQKVRERINGRRSERTRLKSERPDTNVTNPEN